MTQFKTFDYVSDLHLDFHAEWTNNTLKLERKTRQLLMKAFGGQQQTTQKKPLLVLAGDVGHMNTQTMMALRVASEYYQHVVFVPGNHDFYLVSPNQRKQYKHSMNRVLEVKQRCLDEQLPVTVAHQPQLVHVNGLSLLCASMWYPLQNQQQLDFFFEKSNDSVCLTDHHQEVHRSYLEHRRFVEDHAHLAEVLVTHTPVALLHDVNHHLNDEPCYLAPVTLHESFPKYLVFGHTHRSVHNQPASYKGQAVPEVRMFSHAWGYDTKDFSVRTLTVE